MWKLLRDKYRVQCKGKYYINDGTVLYIIHFRDTVMCIMRELGVDMRKSRRLHHHVYAVC